MDDRETILKTLPKSELLRLERVCSKFEKQWSLESISDIAGLVLQAKGKLQSVIAAELIALDVEMRRSQNEPVDKELYLNRLPGYAQLVHEQFAGSSEGDFQYPTNSDSIPKRIGDYRIIRFIGAGGVGAVYEGVQESLGRRVAIKTLTQSHLSSHVFRFQLEAKAIALLHHTNIVDVFGSGIHQGMPYFAMQLIEGQDLSEVVKSVRAGESSKWAGPDAQKEVARIGLEIARALEHAHDQGILHRDIKPSNLLLDESGTVWVTDFGLAKLVDSKTQDAKTAGLVGTIQYVPPEGFSGRWDERSDVYALGLTLYELLVLEPAFEGEDYRQLISKVSTNRFPADRLGSVKGISKDLETIITKAASQEPEGRYQSAGDLADELQRYLDGIPIKARPISSYDKARRWAKRSPAAAGLAGLTALVAFVGLPVVLWLFLRASSALETVSAQKETAVQLQQSIESSRDDSERARYGSTALLAQNYVDGGQSQEAQRTLENLMKMLPDSEVEAGSLPWEIQYLQERIDTSLMTLAGDEKYGVWQVAVSPDDSQIATVHSLLPDPPTDLKGEVILWDSTSGRRMHVLRDDGSLVGGCGYRHDGRVLATVGLCEMDSGNWGTLCLWDVESGDQISRTVMPGKFDKYVTTSSFGVPLMPRVAFSEDDRFVVTWPRPVEVRDAKTMDLVWRRDGQSAVLLSDDRLLVCNGNQFEIHRLSTGELLAKKQVDIRDISGARLSANGRSFSCLSLDKIRVWGSVGDFSKFKAIAAPGLTWGALTDKSSECFLGLRGGELKQVHLDPGDFQRNRTFLGHEGNVTDGCLTHDRQRLISGGVDGTAKVWSLRSEEIVANTNIRHAKIANICFDAQGTKLHFVGRRTDVPAVPRNAGSFDLATGEFSKHMIASTDSARWPRNDFAYSPGGKWLAAPVSESEEVSTTYLGHAEVNEVGIWQTNSWEKCRSVTTDFASIHAVHWFDDGDLIAVAGQREDVCSVKLLDAHSDQSIPRGELEIPGPVVAMDIRQALLAVSTERQLGVWKVESGTSERYRFTKLFQIPTDGKLTGLDFSPNENRLAAADSTNHDLVVFEVATGEVCYRRPGPRALSCVSFSPCGTRLAMSGYDSNVHLCESESGYRLLTLKGGEDSAGTVGINSKVVFSPDGRIIATNTWRGQIRFWEVGRQNELERTNVERDRNTN